MNEYEIYFLGSNGNVWSGFFYGKDETDAKHNAVHQGVSANNIRSIRFVEKYRGYGHI